MKFLSDEEKVERAQSGIRRQARRDGLRAAGSEPSASFVLVRVYSDGSRVRIGPAMSLDDAWGCMVWWNYFDSGRYEAETL